MKGIQQVTEREGIKVRKEHQDTLFTDDVKLYGEVLKTHKRAGEVPRGVKCWIPITAPTSGSAYL